MRFLVIPRVYLGIIFLYAAYSKLTVPVGFPVALRGFLNAVALPNAYPWYKPFIQGVVLPHLSLFATLIIAGELVAGITLLLGIATRAGAIVAIVLNCNYLMAKGLPPWAPSSNDAADIILAVTVLLCAAGQYYGLDAILTKRRYARR